MDCSDKACIAIILALCLKIKATKRKRIWMKDWLKKKEHYSHLVLLNEIRLKEAQDFQNYFRMGQEKYDALLRMVEPFLVRQNTQMRECLPVSERLAVTLRYLATGRNFEDLKFSAIMSPASISRAILEVCEVLIYVLQEYIKFPRTPEEWTNIAKDFENLNSFYNTLGAIDGKHIAIRKPGKSGSLYYNYKGFYSIVLLAVVNARKEFIMVDAGMNGRVSDGGVMFYSKFGEMLQHKILNLPKPLPNNNKENFPYVFVADEAFALGVNLMKPYSQKLLNEARHKYNKRLSTARVNVENAFGIMASKFGVFQKPISLEPKKAETITLACCYLHNFLMKDNNQYCILNENTTNECSLVDLQSTLSRNSTSDAKQIRDKFCSYYNNEGNLL